MKYLIILGLLLSGNFVFSQEKVSNPNPHSVYPIDDADILYKAQIWRKMDLREKVNQPFFANNNEISKFLIQGVKAGLIKPYANDSLNKVLTPEQFSERMKNKGIKVETEFSEAEKAAGLGGKPVANVASISGDENDDGWGGVAKSATKSTVLESFSGNSSGEFDYLPKDLTIIEIREFAIIDRKRSRLYFDIQALTLKAPSTETSGGIEEEIASFSFKEVHKYFKDREDCVWFNSNNEMQHRNMSQAFDLRFFIAPIIKKGNGANQFIADENGMDAVKALKKSQKLEQQLQDKEAEMWEN